MFLSLLYMEYAHFIHRYEQVDADHHIAQCLQAVMNFEEENNLVLF